MGRTSLKWPILWRAGRKTINLVPYLYTGNLRFGWHPRECTTACTCSDIYSGLWWHATVRYDIPAHVSCFCSHFRGGSWILEGDSFQEESLPLPPIVIYWVLLWWHATVRYEIGLPAPFHAVVLISQIICKTITILHRWATRWGKLSTVECKEMQLRTSSCNKIHRQITDGCH